MDKPIPEAVTAFQLMALIDWHGKDGTRKGELTTAALLELHQTRSLTAAQQQGQAAPPSTPVGVEELPPDVKEIIRKDEAGWALAKLAESHGARRDEDDNKTWWVLDIGHFKAIAQQPAAVDRAVVVLTELVATLAATGTVTGGRIYFPERQTRELLKKARDALAQRPAAVDEACAVAAIQFALTDPEGMTFLRLWNEGEFDTLRREWPDAMRKIYIGADPLATQHQEPTT